MKLLFTSLITIILASPIFSQNTRCDSLQNQQLRYFEIRNETSEQWLYQNFYNLTGCGIDSVDVEMLLGGSLLPDLVSKLLQDRHPAQPVIMNDIIISYKPLSNQKEFQEMKDKLTKVLTILKPKVTLENWPAIKAALQELQVFRADLDKAEQSLSYAIENNLTYKQLFKALDKVDTATALESLADKKPWTYQNIDISEAMTLSKSTEKPLILFFTCHACLNALKMEDYVLNDHQVRPLLDQQFIFVALYVDDKTPIEEVSFRNLGQKNLAFQKEKFKTDRQPFFVLMDVDGNVLRTSGYTSSVDDFMVFLKKKQ